MRRLVFIDDDKSELHALPFPASFPWGVGLPRRDHQVDLMVTRRHAVAGRIRWWAQNWAQPEASNSVPSPNRRVIYGGVVR